MITAQKAAALRKAHEAAPTNKSNVHTPQEFSRLKWEKEEKRKQMQLQHETQMRATMAQRQLQGLQGQPGMPNVALQQQRIATPGGVNVPAQMANAASQAGLAPLNPNMTPRTHPAQQNMQANFPNANMSGMPINTPGVPQAQMQANLQNSQRMAPPDQIRLAMQRGQYSATTPTQFQLQQQQQMHMAQNLVANMGNGMLPNTGMMNSMTGQNMIGAMNSALNGPTSNAGSPRVNQANPQMQNQARPMAISHMPQLVQLQNKFRNQHPDWSQEQIQKAAGEHLQRMVTSSQRMQAQQQALASAAGQPTANMNARVPPSGVAGSPQLGNTSFMPNGGMQSSPSPNPVSVSNYQAQLLQQQRNMMSQQHQQAGSPGISARPMSRSATPQNPQQLGIQSPGTAQQPRA